MIILADSEIVLRTSISLVFFFPSTTLAREIIQRSGEKLAQVNNNHMYNYTFAVTVYGRAWTWSKKKTYKSLVLKNYFFFHRRIFEYYISLIFFQNLSLYFNLKVPTLSEAILKNKWNFNINCISFHKKHYKTPKNIFKKVSLKTKKLKK